ncbi:hypothetical protein ZWY2020_022213 [Hordeum vulgare]|nr:hypothetical protein ZWY2020_022213 [Hordeum vulgare]
MYLSGLSDRRTLQGKQQWWCQMIIVQMLCTKGASNNGYSQRSNPQPQLMSAHPTSRILVTQPISSTTTVFQQDQRWPPFSGGTCSTDQHQHQHHHYPQSRQDTPGGSGERYTATTSMGAGSYGQRHHEAPHRQKRGGRRTYPWGFQP